MKFKILQLLVLARFTQLNRLNITTKDRAINVLNLPIWCNLWDRNQFFHPLLIKKIQMKVQTCFSPGDCPAVRASRSRHAAQDSRALICHVGRPAIDTKWRTWSSTVFRKRWSRVSWGDSSGGPSSAWASSSWAGGAAGRPSGGQCSSSSVSCITSYCMSKK